MRITEIIIATSICVSALAGPAHAAPGDCDAFARTVLETQILTKSATQQALDRGLSMLRAAALRNLPFEIDKSGSVKLPAGATPDRDGLITIPAVLIEADYLKLGLTGDNDRAAHERGARFVYRVRLKHTQLWSNRTFKDPHRFYFADVIDWLQVAEPDDTGALRGPSIQFAHAKGRPDAPMSDRGSCYPARVLTQTIQNPKVLSQVYSFDECHRLAEVFQGRTIRVGTRLRPIADCAFLNFSNLRACGEALSSIDRERWSSIAGLDEPDRTATPESRMLKQVTRWRAACAVPDLDGHLETYPSGNTPETLRTIIENSVTAYDDQGRPAAGNGATVARSGSAGRVP